MHGDESAAESDVALQCYCGFVAESEQGLAVHRTRQGHRADHKGATNSPGRAVCPHCGATVDAPGHPVECPTCGEAYDYRDTIRRIQSGSRAGRRLWEVAGLE